MTDFKAHVENELVSLGAFAFTIDVTLFIMIVTILLIQGVEKVVVSIFPLTNLLLMVFATAVISITVYFN